MISSIISLLRIAAPAPVVRAERTSDPTGVPRVPAGIDPAGRTGNARRHEGADQVASHTVETVAVNPPHDERTKMQLIPHNRRSVNWKRIIFKSVNWKRIVQKSVNWKRTCLKSLNWG